ncbi:MAG: beta-propeller fold lactonase family protein [Candidatus Dadabacteria bacterium]|nr:beta-propeller fold lactonase family protein [Candidatus Dadabacteria bacterium]
MIKFASCLISTFMLFVLVSGFTGCMRSATPEVPDSAPVADEMVSAMADSERFLYTSSNDPAGNNIIALSIGSDGLLTEIGTVSTGGVGDADDGDFDGQHALYIIPGTNYLLAVNAGDSSGEEGAAAGNGSVSVFTIDNDTGLVVRVDQTPQTSTVNNIDSGGVRPISIGSAVVDGTTWVLVANQYHNPFYGGNAKADGLSNTRAGDSTDEIKVTSLRNITAFEFNDGVLSSPRTVVTYESGDHGGPTQVAFSPDGSKVGVSTWGVAQFGKDVTTNAEVQGASRLYVYDVSSSANGLELINERYFQQPGISGSIGYSWSPDSNNVFVANFNLALAPKSWETYGITVISTGAKPELVGHAEIPGTDDEACWTLLTPDGTNLYAASFAKNKVSFFEVSPTDGLTLKQSLTRTNVPLADTKDMYITKDGKYFYVSGALMSHTISIYDVDASGLLTEVESSPYEVPSSHPNGENVGADSQAFLGLVGY